ncbi:MAG: hypothetical protein ACYC8T_22270 [Myxococcaceae bacterium]
MKLERHVGGLSNARKVEYLLRRGWREEDGHWSCERLGLGPIPVKKAVHHQLTEDLSRALVVSGWAVLGYSERGYAQLKDPLNGRSCSLPAALRRQARREKRPVGELTYALFLAALLD